MNKNRIILLITLMLLTGATQLFAQSDDFGIWTSVEVKKRIIKGLNVSAEGEFRTRDNVSEVDRWAGSLAVDYKIFPFLKASTGYAFIYYNNPEKVTGSGKNYRPSYWGERHRFNLALTGEVKWNRFAFSLRERWQYTLRPEQTVDEFKVETGEFNEVETIAKKEKNVLRSRLAVEYDIKQSKFTPYASCELYHVFNASTGNGHEKTRWTVGTSYKLNKKNSFDVFYRYQTKSDEDEPNGHILGIGYSYKF